MALTLESLRGNPNKHDRILELMATASAIVESPDDEERAQPDPSFTTYLAGVELETLTEMLMVCSMKADEDLPFRGFTFVRSDEAWLELRDLLISPEIREGFRQKHTQPKTVEIRNRVRAADHIERWLQDRIREEEAEAKR
ncbi:hypothetical protein SAMN02983003_2042 [Devosia enhydra]|uniref:Uncharacterized protein n=2 Tax=Devosia enhydra TaxID=665118 RepID=A0A1K2HZD4_9HYPH|nr:hypothetical protein SAMN02983003_2042 [Devosia enhydra]